MDHVSTPITLEEVNPESEWIIEAMNLIFSDDDLDWVDQEDIEAEVVAMVEDEDRALENTYTTDVSQCYMESHDNIWLLHHPGPTLDAFVGEM